MVNTPAYTVEMSYDSKTWKTIHTVGNAHAAEVFAEKRARKGSRVRVKDTILDRIIWEA